MILLNAVTTFLLMTGAADTTAASAERAASLLTDERDAPVCQPWDDCEEPIYCG